MTNYWQSFSGRVRRVFQLSGYVPGRLVPIDEFATLVIRRGFNLSSMARDALEQFYGLKVWPGEYYKDSVAYFRDAPHDEAEFPEDVTVSNVHFPFYQFGWVEFGFLSRPLIANEELPYLEQCVGIEACPIGHGGIYYFFIQPTGQVVLLGELWTHIVRFATLADALESTLFRGHVSFTEL